MCCAPSTSLTPHNTPPLLSIACPMPFLLVLFEFINTFIINLVHEQALNQEIQHQIFDASSLSVEIQHLCLNLMISFTHSKLTCPWNTNPVSPLITPTLSPSSLSKGTTTFKHQNHFIKGCENRNFLHHRHSMK